MENYIYPGTIINPDKEKLETIEEKIKNNLGYCVTAITETGTPINLRCPCLKYRERGECLCGKFVAKVPKKPIPSAPRSNMEGKVVVITKSLSLYELNLGYLVDHKGIVIEDLTSSSRKSKGCVVRLIGGSYLGEESWFIPLTSISVLKK